VGRTEWARPSPDTWARPSPPPRPGCSRRWRRRGEAGAATAATAEQRPHCAACASTRRTRARALPVRRSRPGPRRCPPGTPERRRATTHRRRPTVRRGRTGGEPGVRNAPLGEKTRQPAETVDEGVLIGGGQPTAHEQPSTSEATSMSNRHRSARAPARGCSRRRSSTRRRSARIAPLRVPRPRRLSRRRCGARPRRSRSRHGGRARGRRGWPTRRDQESTADSGLARLVHQRIKSRRRVAVTRFCRPRGSLPAVRHSSR